MGGKAWGRGKGGNPEGGVALENSVN